MLCERRDLDRTVHSEGTFWVVVSVVAVFWNSSLLTVAGLAEPLVLQENPRCAGSELLSSRRAGCSVLSLPLR